MSNSKLWTLPIAHLLQIVIIIEDSQAKGPLGRLQGVGGPINVKTVTATKDFAEALRGESFFSPKMQFVGLNTSRTCEVA